MLMKLLYEMTQISNYSNKKMAEKLGTSEEMIKQMILQLKKMGYIEEDSTAPSSCSGGCIGCAGACSCSKNPATIWVITEKGSQVLEKLYK